MNYHQLDQVKSKVNSIVKSIVKALMLYRQTVLNCLNFGRLKEAFIV